MKPYFLLSKSKVLEQYNKLASLGLHVSYSFKTNPEVAKVLESTVNCDFSCHTIKPIDIIKDSNKVWFFPQGWNKDDLKALLKKGVNKFVIDNIGDLKILDGITEKITLLFRIKMKEHTIHTGKYFVYGFDTESANKLIIEYSKKPFIKELGIHFHRKTENVSEWSIKEELIDSISTWDKIKIVNIGGGLPIKYSNVKDFNIDYILSKVVELRDFLKTKKIQLMVEPGRFISGPSVKLVTQVTNLVNNTVFLNCSVYNTFPDTIIYGLKLPVEGEGTGTTYLIKGCTACSLDIFRYKVSLPSVKIGDTITFENAGAYNFYTDFMWLDKPETKITE